MYFNLQMGFLLLQGQCHWTPWWSHWYCSQASTSGLATLVWHMIFTLQTVCSSSRVYNWHELLQEYEEKRSSFAALLEKGGWRNIWYQFLCLSGLWLLLKLLGLSMTYLFTRAVILYHSVFHQKCPRQKGYVRACLKSNICLLRRTSIKFDFVTTCGYAILSWMI